MQQIRSTATRFAVAATILVVFGVDAVAPFGVNVPILYLLPLLVIFLTERVRIRVALTLLISCLMVSGMAWETKWTGDWITGSVNRCFDLGVFWVALALSVRDARTTRQLRDLRRALDTASIVSIMGTNGLVTHVNDGFCAISKYSREELIGRPHELLKGHAESKAPGRDLWSTIAAGEIWHGEIRGRAKGGSTYWVDTTIVPLFGDGGVPYLYLSIHHDITDQKRAETRLRSQAVFAKIAEMAALVAHEVRNPLAGVRGALQLFGRRESLSSADLVLTRQMIERLDLLDAHVKALLHFAQPRSPQVQPVPIRSLLEQVAKSVLNAHATGNVPCEIVGPDVRVLGDPVMLQEIFTNLLVNAVEAQAGAGRIEITVSAAGDTASIAIADAGPGIPPTLHERIFEPFFTTKTVGAGLGLPIVRQLVELLGGDVVILTSSPSGTTMQVRLPLAVEVAAVA